MKSIILFLLLLGGGLFVQAQNLTGIWRGNFRRTPTAANSKLMELLGSEERYKFEVQLDQHSKQFKGVTYSYLTTVFYGKATCQGTVDTRTKKVILEEVKITEVRMAGGSDACIMTLFLQYSKQDDEEFLEGNYISFNVKDSTNCGKGTVFLRKVTTSDFYEEPFLVQRKAREKALAQKPAAKKPNNPPVAKTNTAPVKKPATSPKTTTPKTTTPKTTPGNQRDAKPATKPPVRKPNTVAKTPEKNPPVPNAKPDVKMAQVDTPQKAVIKPFKLPENIPVPKVIASRENELVKTITTDAGEVTVDIYDNGTVDNDTISVYLDKKLVLAHRRLTEKPITLKIKLDDDNNYHELVMVAENLGEIPPNTSLMVVNAGNKTYDVRISNNEQKNAVVIFKYQK